MAYFNRFISPFFWSIVGRASSKNTLVPPFSQTLDVQFELNLNGCTP
ncbi:hypothetical protein B481_0373 [Planococcus halocryophilus Or1]|nr:hypothetical protein B481_0373 [Planococcus halocryophilus Or1]